MQCLSATQPNFSSVSGHLVQGHSTSLIGHQQQQESCAIPKID